VTDGDVEDLGQKLETHADGTFLEVIPEAPVAEHLKHREVAAVAHLIDVLGAHAALHIHEALAGRVRFSEDVGHEWMHACSREEHRGVILWYERRPRDHRVLVAFEEVEIGVPEVVGGEWLHGAIVAGFSLA
jgi:hypothetical protein